MRKVVSWRPLDWLTVTTTSEKSKRLLLIDGHSMAFRAFYALSLIHISEPTRPY